MIYKSSELFTSCIKFYSFYGVWTKINNKENPISINPVTQKNVDLETNFNII